MSSRQVTSLKSLLMPAYRLAPARLQALASSVWGRYLTQWRYGPESERLVAEALERETWDQESWDTYAEDRLAELLRGTAKHVPYYRDMWNQRRANGDNSSVEELANWPVLTKAELRARPESFLRDDVNTRRLFKLSSSGTSGTPITVWRSRAGLRAWYALFEARWRRWYGVTRHDPWAIIGGQEVVPASRSEPPFWVWNGGANQLYLSNLHISRANAPAFVDAMHKYGIVHAFSYSSSLAELARHVLADGLKPPRLRVAVTNAEPLTHQQRELITEAFGCPVRETYGMTESVAGASECESGVLHLWPDAAHVEVLQDGSNEPVAPGETGRLVGTGFVHWEMPLVRFEIGDRGKVTVDAERCGCGRQMPRLEAIEGRLSDNLVTPDGRKVFWINPVFYDLPIHEAQVIQESVDHLTVNVVPGSGFGPDHERSIVVGLERRLGKVDVDVRLTDKIPRGPNGKFRPVVNNIDAGAAQGE